MINNIIDTIKSANQTSNGMVRDLIISNIHKKTEATRVQDPVKTESGDTFSNNNSDKENSQYVNNFINEMNSELNNKNLQLVYVKDKETQKHVIQMKDIKTNEVIKQIPTKQILAISKQIDDYLTEYDKDGKTKVNRNYTIIDEIV